MTKDINIYKVFTDDISQGNAAAVMEYSGWSDAELLELARHSGAPVTVFVQNSSDPEQDAVLRYFSSEKEMTFCGHGTLAAGAFMLQQCQLDRLQVTSWSGTPIVITKSPQGHYYFKTERARNLDTTLNRAEIAHMLGIKPEVISDHAPFIATSIGSPKLLVPLRHLTDLDEMAPKFEEIKEWSRKHCVNGVYAYAFQAAKEMTPESGSVYVHARGFNPLFGISEDAATGVAAGALGDLLFQAGGPSTYVFKQGKHVGAESEIRVIVRAESVEIGGSVLHLK
ncbi:PhzF family phenazine biosynthesis protein [Paenibacillus sp. YSY-4.3]